MYFYDFYLNCYFVIETISFHKLKYFGKAWKTRLACDMIFPQLSNGNTMKFVHFLQCRGWMGGGGAGGEGGWVGSRRWVKASMRT